MAESVYKVIELIGTSTTSWEKAAAAAVNTASLSLTDLRVAEVSELDMHIVDGKIAAYRAKVKLSFKYLTGSEKPGAEDAAPKAAAKAAPARAKKAPAPAAAAPATPAPAPAKKAARKGKRKG